MAANENVSDPPDEVQQVDEHLIRQIRRRLLWCQVALWLAPLLVVPVAVVCLTTVLGVEPLSLLWYTLMVGLVIGIAYCGHLEALLSCKRRGWDPRQHRGRMIGNIFFFVLVHCFMLTLAGIALFFAILSHMGC